MRRLTLCCVAMAFAGCGVSDYERRMDLERARIKFFDEENKHLGEIIEIPVRTIKVKTEDGKDNEQVAPAWPFEVFLRLPKGIDKTPPEKGGIHPVNDLTFVRYAATEPGNIVGNVIVVAAPVGVPDDKGKLKPGEWSVADFRVEVRLGVGAMLKKTLKAMTPLKDIRKPITHKGEEQPPIEYQALVYDFEGTKDAEGKETDPGMHLSIFLHSKAGRQVGIAYETAHKNRIAPAFLAAVDRSLKSLDISEQATERRERFARLRQ